MSEDSVLVERVARLGRDMDGPLDEIVANGKVHLEQMSDNHWSLIVSRPDFEDRVLIAFHSRTKITASVIEPECFADKPPRE
jgi:hypothetical protein